MVSDSLLDASEGPALAVDNAAGGSSFVLVCEHASNRIPACLGTLGLDQTALVSHAAWDIGARGVAQHLSEALDAPLVRQHFSRLVYDCNRPPEAEDAIPAQSEIYPIPGNENLGPSTRRQRTDAIYRPFHDALSTVLTERSARGMRSILVTIHSFTPIYHGFERDMHLGILHDADTLLADRLLDAAADWPDVVARRNQPYGPEDGVTHTLQLHGLTRGLPNAMIEIRNDLIADAAGQKRWADRLAYLLRAAAGEWEESNR